jgi:hypothetical protein
MPDPECLSATWACHVRAEAAALGDPGGICGSVCGSPSPHQGAISQSTAPKLSLMHDGSRKGSRPQLHTRTGPAPVEDAPERAHRRGLLATSANTQPRPSKHDGSLQTRPSVLTIRPANPTQPWRRRCAPSCRTPATSRRSSPCLTATSNPSRPTSRLAVRHHALSTDQPAATIARP